MLSDSQAPTFCVDARRQTRERRSHKQITSFLWKTPLRTSAREHLGMAGNSAFLSVTCNECFSSTSEGWAEYPAPQPPNLWQNLWSPAASGSHYPCHLPNKLLYWAHSWGAGVMFVSWHNYCYIVFSQYVHNIAPLNNTLGVMWLERRRQRRIFISLMLATVYILALSSLLFHKTPSWGLKPQSQKCL